jgi:hypothetical protein
LTAGADYGHEILNHTKIKEDEVDNLPFADFSWAAYDWIKNNPI